MRHDGEVQLLQVDTLGLHIVREDVGVVSGIKQDALAAILDERGEPPILPPRRSVAEGIVKDGDLGRARLSIGRRGANGCRGHRHCSQGEEEMPRHETPSTARGWRECGCGVKPRMVRKLEASAPTTEDHSKWPKIEWLLQPERQG